jgi:hypothetical protein
VSFDTERQKRKELKMRLSPTFLAIGVTLLALGAQAQTPAKIEHPSNENAFSVFVYDRLGATPSLRMAPREAKPAQARVKADAPARESTKVAPAVHAGAAATAADTQSAH